MHKKKLIGTSLAVQQLRLRACTAWGAGLIPAWATKNQQATWHGQKKPKNYK